MAGTLVKRHREVEEEETDIQKFDENREAKRYKKQALVSYLEQEEGEEEEEVVVSSQDLSLFLSTLQQELFSDPSEPDPHGPHQTLLLEPSTEDWNPCSRKEDNEDEDKENVIRHLFEASDDELGLPNEVVAHRTVSSVDEDFNRLDDKHNPSLFCDGLWELEDEAANYYTLLQSQLFM